MKKIFSLLLFCISIFLYSSETGAMPPPPRCEQYTYSNCPSYGCEKTCKSSHCDGNICTSDCDGPGSCHLPIAKSCIKEGEKFKFYVEGQFCCDGLTKTIGKGQKNMIPGFSTCIKIDGFCNTKYEDFDNSSDCRKNLIKKEGEIIGSGVYPVGQTPKCASGLTAVWVKDAYDINGKLKKPFYYDQICIKKGDGFCNTKYENEFNSPSDCKKVGLYALSFDHPSGYMYSNNNKVFLVKFDLISGKIKNKKIIKELGTFKSDLYRMYYSKKNPPKKCYNSKFIGTKFEGVKDQYGMYISSSLDELISKLKQGIIGKYPANFSGNLCNNGNFWTVFIPNKKLINKIKGNIEKICTREYNPVCGQPPLPECLKLGTCRMPNPLPKTYSNKCELEKAGAKFMYYGKCSIEQKIPKNCSLWYDGCNNCTVKDGQIFACTKRYCIRHDTPKCLEFKEVRCPLNSIPPQEIKPNCKIIQENYIFKGKTCTRPKIVCEKQEFKISENLKKQIKNIVYKFMEKLDKSGLTAQQKINKLNNIINRIPNIIERFPKYKDIFGYLSYLLKEQVKILEIYKSLGL